MQRRTLLRRLAFEETAFPSSRSTPKKGLDQLTEEELPRVLTASAVSTVLVPWRTAETRDLAVRVVRNRKDLAAMVLRTHYGDNDKWAEMMEVRECGDDGFEMEDEGWSVLDGSVWGR